MQSERRKGGSEGDRGSSTRVGEIVTKSGARKRGAVEN